ncbi:MULTISPECIES: hypothetical protein [Streptomyces]|uniref:hypothetical protein n=1 Tax=Streptomyces TaxID=1883 RepID=UPI0029BD90B9|nr:hypothetical protein [Streptomyces sp. NRRL_B-2557]MDX2748348.1 hypothetical protein [Streptomyces sp. NRRL_B-2557]
MGITSLLLLAGCGPQSAGQVPAGSASPSAGGSPTGQPDRARLEAMFEDQARQFEATPTREGLSLAQQSGSSASYVWETTTGKVCFGQASSGAAQEIACIAGRDAMPEEKDSRITALFGPGMGFAESYIVFSAEPGVTVKTVKYRGREVPWRFVRRVNAERTEPAVYYVTLPDGHKGWINVILEQADGQLTPDRLQVTLF